MRKDLRWFIIWVSVTTVLGIWNVLFLNRPALKAVSVGFYNTLIVALLVVVFSLVLGWATTLMLHSLEKGGNRGGFLGAVFFLNLLRSIPQIVGILFGYVAISSMRNAEIIRSDSSVLILLSLCTTLFVFSELVELMRERIGYYEKLDFYNAMRVCGISDLRIINANILWRNSRLHIFNKLIAIFGTAVFLQCSVDFIVSVGLSTEVSSVSLPSTLGGLLASIDSKQDILAIGYALTHPLHIPRLFFQHLQGVTVAFLLVFTLLSVYNISNGFAQRHRL